MVSEDSNVQSAAAAADRKLAENDAKPAGETEELDVGDFKAAANQAAETISKAVQNVKETLAPAAADGSSDAATTTTASAGDKPVAAASPVEETGVFSQVVEKIFPVALAESRGPGDKWGDAKEEARESGRQAQEAGRDTLSALGDETRRGGERLQGYVNRAGDASVEASREFVGVSKDAAERVRRDWPGEQLRDARREVEGLAQGAKDRVAADWQSTKEGTERLLDESSAHRQWQAEHAPKKEERGWFSWLFGSGDKAADEAKDAADRGRDAARDAANTVQDKAQEAADKAKGFFNKTGNEAERTTEKAEAKTRSFFGRATDEVERTAEKAKSEARGLFGRGSDDVERTADKAKSEARGWWDSSANEADRAGAKARGKVDRWSNKLSDTAEDAKRSVQDTVDDLLPGDLAPPITTIPSNTADLLASRRRR